MSRDRRGNGIQEVDGSIPFGSTIQVNNLRRSERVGVLFLGRLTVTLTATGPRERLSPRRIAYSGSDWASGAHRSAAPVGAIPSFWSIPPTT